VPPAPHIFAPLRAIALATALSAAPAAAQEAPALHLELNDLSEVPGGCQISFLAANATGADLDAVVFEAVLIDGQGRVDRLTLFDFGALPAERPRVRQFVLPDIACADLGRILINGAHRCETGGAASPACGAALRPTTRTGVELAG
jgi:hypothetical protein